MRGGAVAGKGPVDVTRCSDHHTTAQQCVQTMQFERFLRAVHRGLTFRAFYSFAAAAHLPCCHSPHWGRQSTLQSIKRSFTIIVITMLIFKGCDNADNCSRIVMIMMVWPTFLCVQAAKHFQLSHAWRWRQCIHITSCRCSLARVVS